MFIQAVNCTISTVCVYSVVAFFEIHITVNKTAMLFFFAPGYTTSSLTEISTVSHFHIPIRVI